MTIASFACPCGGQDEVREPAPARVDCWSCRGKLSARRWTPSNVIPEQAGREPTAEELVRARHGIGIRDRRVR